MTTGPGVGRKCAGWRRLAIKVGLFVLVQASRRHAVDGARKSVFDILTGSEGTYGHVWLESGLGWSCTGKIWLGGGCKCAAWRGVAIGDGLSLPPVRVVGWQALDGARASALDVLTG